MVIEFRVSYYKPTELIKVERVEKFDNYNVNNLDNTSERNNHNSERRNTRKINKEGLNRNNIIDENESIKRKTQKTIRRIAGVDHEAMITDFNDNDSLEF